MLLFHAAAFLLYSSCYVDGLRLTGRWDSSQFFTILAKFGFQQTDHLDESHTRGFVYGNVTAMVPNGAISRNTSVLLALVRRSLFGSMFEARDDYPSDISCEHLLRDISAVAYDAKCMPSGQQDSFRWVPCPRGQYCPDEDNPKNVLSGFQLTYHVQESYAPGFWYLVMAACQLNEQPQCNWTRQTRPVTVDYDLWLVNGSPLVRYMNPFEHQFSFDEQDTAEMYFAALGIYVLLLGMQYRAVVLFRRGSTQRVPDRQRLLSAVCFLETGGLLLCSLNILTFAYDGSGALTLRWIGDLMRLASMSVLSLLLILLARGWSIVDNELRSFRFVATFWGSLSILHAIFFVWNSRAVDEIEEVDIFETWPGFGILLLRVVQAVWFLVEIKRSIDGELDEEKAEFLTHFGAGFLVWFVHLPMLGVVASKIELLWRFKIILAINLFANTLASAILVHLFWPMSTNRRFFAADDRMHRLLNHSEEMDEFEKSLIDEEFVPSDPAVEDDDLCPVFTPTSL